MEKNYVRQISPNAWIAGTRDAGAVITQTDLNVESDVGDIKKLQSKEFMSWGAANTLPSQRELLVRDNNVVAQLIGTARDITLGQGLFAYRKRYKSDPYGKRELIREEVDIPTQAQDFFDLVDIDKENLCGAGELFLHENLFTQFVLNKGARLGNAKIESMETKRCRNVRAARQDSKGKVKNYLWKGTWAKKNANREENKNITTIKALDPEKLEGTFMHHTGDPLLFDGYYYHPKYWGAKTWISLANAIPLFHLHNLENGYNVRFHIEIPADYFKDTTVTTTDPAGLAQAEKNEEAARQAFLDIVNKFLSGIQNPGRALFTTYDYSVQLGKEFPGIRITPIDFDMKDEALIKLFEASNTATISSLGIHPTLAAIETAGKLSSGSEMRNAYNVHLAVKTPTPRRLLLERILLAKKIEGWDADVFFGFKDIEIQKLDDEKSGKSTTNENNV